jgi:hypothetical protein
MAHNKKGDMTPEQRLISVCTKCIEAFVPERVTPTTHADTFLQTQKGLSETDEVFIRQVFYGLERYKSFIKITLDSLYHMRAGKTSRNDIVLYQIFTYLAVIRLGQDLGFPQFRLLVLGQDQSKLYVFLQFLFDKEIMRTVLREVWYAMG